jgi:hypothetical protein
VTPARVLVLEPTTLRRASESFTGFKKALTLGLQGKKKQQHTGETTLCESVGEMCRASLRRKQFAFSRGAESHGAIIAAAYDELTLPL